MVVLQRKKKRNLNTDELIQIQLNIRESTSELGK